MTELLTHPDCLKKHQQLKLEKAKVILVGWLFSMLNMQGSQNCELRQRLTDWPVFDSEGDLSKTHCAKQGGCQKTHYA